MKLTSEEIERLTADPTKVDLPMPTLEELDFALHLIHRRYRVDAWVARRRLKWIVKMMDKHYDVKWVHPWK